MRQWGAILLENEPAARKCTRRDNRSTAEPVGAGMMPNIAAARSPGTERNYPVFAHVLWWDCLRGCRLMPVDASPPHPQSETLPDH